MKSFAVLAAVCALAVPAFAQKAPATPTKVKCPVMKEMMVVVKDAQKAKLYVDYKKKRYFVCCAGCVPAFKADPAKYAKGATGLPIPKKG